MQAVLNINQNEIDSNLLSVVKSLFQKDSIDEIVIKRAPVVFEEFDASKPLDSVMEELKGAGHSAEFLAELQDGLAKSSAYKK